MGNKKIKMYIKWHEVFSSS